MTSEPGPPPPLPLRPDEKTWGMLAHLASIAAMLVGGLAVIGPLVVWLVKKNESAYVDHHGKEALNFQITMLIATAVAAVSLLACIGIVLLPAVIVVNLVFSILAAVKANDGVMYRYPISIRFV